MAHLNSSLFRMLFDFFFLFFLYSLFSFFLLLAVLLAVTIFYPFIFPSFSKQTQPISSFSFELCAAAHTRTGLFLLLFIGRIWCSQRWWWWRRDLCSCLSLLLYHRLIFFSRSPVCVFMLIYFMRYQSRYYYWLLHGLWRPDKRHE